MLVCLRMGWYGLMFSTRQTHWGHTRGSVCPQRFCSLFLLLTASDLQLLTLPLTERQILPERMKETGHEESEWRRDWCCPHKPEGDDLKLQGFNLCLVDYFQMFLWVIVQVSDEEGKLSNKIKWVKSFTSSFFHLVCSAVWLFAVILSFTWDHENISNTLNFNQSMRSWDYTTTIVFMCIWYNIIYINCCDWAETITTEFEIKPCVTMEFFSV